VDAHGVGVEGADGGPEVGVGGVAHAGDDLRLEAGPAAGFDEAKDGDERGAGPDEDELQHLIDDGGAQAAEHDVDGDGDGADPDGEVDVPAEYDLHDEGHGVHVDAGHEDGHEGEADGGEAAGALAEAELEVAGDGVGLRDVVEGHHDDAEEEHSGDGADPVPVGGEDAVLVGCAGPAHELEGAEVCGDEAETGDPCGHLAAGEEELFAGVGGALHVEADEDDHREVEAEDGVVDRREVGELGGEEDGSGAGVGEEYGQEQVHRVFGPFCRCGLRFSNARCAPGGSAVEREFSDVEKYTDSRCSALRWA
jgi:hypothetical protein